MENSVYFNITITELNPEMHVTTYYSRHAVTYKVAIDEHLADYYKLHEEVTVIGILRDGWIVQPEIKRQDFATLMGI